MYLLFAFILIGYFCRVLWQCGLGSAKPEEVGELVQLASPHKTGTIFRQSFVENIAFVFVVEQTHISHCRLVETIFERHIVDKRSVRLLSSRTTRRNASANDEVEPVVPEMLGELK